MLNPAGAAGAIPASKLTSLEFGLSPKAFAALIVQKYFPGEVTTSESASERAAGSGMETSKV